MNTPFGKTNGGRVALNPLEEGEEFNALILNGTNAQEIANTVRKSRSYIYHRIWLLGLIDEAKEQIRQGKLEWSHAFEFCRLSQPMQRRVLAMLEEQPIGVRELRKKINELKAR